MNIAFIGYGDMTTALASNWTGSHDLFVGGHNPDKAKKVADELGAAGGDSAEAAAFGDVVVLATPHTAVFDAIGQAGGPGVFAGKVVVDINNALGYEAGDFAPKVYDDGPSLAESIQARLPEARVVKAFNMANAEVWRMDPPSFDGRRLVTPVAGDNAEAKRQVMELVTATGSEPLDLGDLHYARLIEAAAGLVIKQIVERKDPLAVLNLVLSENPS